MLRSTILWSCVAVAASYAHIPRPARAAPTTSSSRTRMAAHSISAVAAEPQTIETLNFLTEDQARSVAERDVRHAGVRVTRSYLLSQSVEVHHVPVSGHGL